MDLRSAVTSLAAGIVVGAICVGGLKWGLHLLLQAQEMEDKPKKTKHLLLASAVLFGQLVLALGILFFFRASLSNPLALGAGLMGSTFLFSLLGRKSG